ncbi:MAG: hypothetical protein JNM36_13090 [Chitinophagales bacterium]|nr:hypothetical protein [Chitinophagales bacterium]
MLKKKWVLESTKTTKPTNKEVLFSLLCGIIVLVLFMFLSIYISNIAYHSKHDSIDNNPAYTLCIVISKNSRKGKTIDVECEINGEKRYYKEAVSADYYYTLKKGDNVSLKYCKDDISKALIVEP